MWSLGYPESGLKNANQAIEVARETGQAASLMFALFMISIFHIACRNYSLANDLACELFTLAKDKGALPWKASSSIFQGCASVASGKPSEAVGLIMSKRTSPQTAKIGPI
jgi:hypothetical protein